jgi:cysteine desulfurase/selenocysteine lyase
MSAQIAVPRLPRKLVSHAVLNGFDVERIRADFPILGERVHGQPLVYLDNAATSQKPEAVIEAIANYYRHQNANIHRGVHLLSQSATEAYEAARAAAQGFIHARDASEIVFVRGTTEAINLVAQTYGRRHIGRDDEVLITTMEHHSNIVPWQILCEEKGAALRVAPMDDRGELLLDEFEKLVGPRTRFVSIAHVSNALGTINPVKQMVEVAHARGVPVLIDGAQAAPHMAIDVVDLDCDFYALSGHKMYGPTGIGILYGKAELLEDMPPYQGGGDMISSVTFAKTTYNKVPHKFEAGTPDIAGVIGLGAAIAYIEKVGLDAIGAHEHDLLLYGTDRLSAVPDVRLIGTAHEKASVLSFVIEGIHPHDIGTILDQEGVAVRTGHHCAQPVMDFYCIPATVRASLALYNTKQEIDALVSGIERVKEILG